MDEFGPEVLMNKLTDPTIRTRSRVSIGQSAYPATGNAKPFRRG
jgi:hypothetical protein